MLNPERLYTCTFKYGLGLFSLYLLITRTCIQVTCTRSTQLKSYSLSSLHMYTHMHSPMPMHTYTHALTPYVFTHLHSPMHTYTHMCLVSSASADADHTGAMQEAWPEQTRTEDADNIHSFTHSKGTNRAVDHIMWLHFQAYNSKYNRVFQA